MDGLSQQGLIWEKLECPVAFSATSNLDPSALSSTTMALLARIFLAVSQRTASIQLQINLKMFS